MEQTLPQGLAPTQAEKDMNVAMVAGLEYVDLGAPILADTDRIVAVLDPIADGALTVAAQPDVPRNITALLTDANDSVAASILVTGVDMFGNVITETITFAAASPSLKTFVGTKLFARVTAAVVSGASGAAAGDTIQIGVGNVIALPKQIARTTSVKYVSLGAVPQTTFTVAVGDITGVDVSAATYDGSKVMRVGYRPGL